MLRIFEWIENTPIGILARESLWGFPILVTIHILGLAISVGILLWFDLRLMGVHMRHTPISIVYRQLVPWFIGGFTVMFISGGALFSGFATLAYANLFFRIKFAAILLAGANALFYHLVTEREINQWDKDAHPPLPVRMAGFFSIVLWTTVILCGRMMSYTMYVPPPPPGLPGG